MPPEKAKKIVAAAEDPAINTAGIGLLNESTIKTTPEFRTGLKGVIEKGFLKLSDLFSLKITGPTHIPQYQVRWTFDMPFLEGYLNVAVMFVGLTIFTGSIKV